MFFIALDGNVAPRTEGVFGAPLAHSYSVHFRQQAHHLLRPQIQDKQSHLPDQTCCNEPNDSVRQSRTKNRQRIQQTASLAKSLRRRPSRTYNRSPAKGSGANAVSCQEDTPVLDAGGPSREPNNPFFNLNVTQSGQPELRPSQKQSRRVREPG